MSYELDSLNGDQNNRLNKALEDMTWIIQIEFKDKNNYYHMFRVAGFCIHASGLFMSCAELIMKYPLKYTKIRMLKDHILYDVELVYTQPSWNIVLLRIAKPVLKSAGKTGNYKFGRFAANGSLTVGQILVHMGHSKPGSYYLCRVSSPCVQNVELPPLNDTDTCRLHRPTGYEKIVQCKTIGHIYNRDFFKSLKVTDNLNHPANAFNPSVPIIEFSGFRSSLESLGGPVINTQGEIVGMVAGVGEESFAIHVTALRHILEVYTQGVAASTKDDSAKLQKKNEEKKKELKPKAQEEGGLGGSGSGIKT